MKIYASRYGKGRLNPNIQKRDQILFGEYDPAKYTGGIRRFENVDAKTIEELVDNGFVDVTMYQKASTTIEEFLDFNEDWDDHYTFIGFAISDRRDDYGIVIDGIRRDEFIHASPETEEERDDFYEFSKNADDVFLDAGYAWWD